jgi:uncharacterized protein (DUF952 family)
MTSTDKIFHMCLVDKFNEAVNTTGTTTGTQDGLYYPPTYNQDGFIHATAKPSLLIPVANYFYKASVGDWICIEIDPSKLPNGPESVIYETAASVGDKQSYHQQSPTEEEVEKFPHIYCGLSAECVVNKYKIVRAEDGTFLSIDGICG